MGKLTRRDFLRLSAVTAVGGALAACAPAQVTQAPAKEVPAKETKPTVKVEEKKEPVTITFWSHEFEPRVKLDNELIAKYTEANPYVTIEYNPVPDDFETKLLTAMAAGTGPVMMNLSWRHAASLIEANAVVPVDPLVMGFDSQQAIIDTYVPGSIDGFIYEGKLMGLPTEVSNYCMFLNKGMFEDAGLGEEDFPKTWDDVIRVSKQLVKREGGSVVQRGFDLTYGVPGDWTSPILSFMGMVRQYGGQILNDEQTESLVNTEPFVRVLKWWQDYVYTHKLGFPELRGANESYLERKVAMTLVGSWYDSSVKENNPDVWEETVVIGFPQFQDQQVAAGADLYAYGHLVNAKATTAQKEEAWRFIYYLDSKADRYLKSTGLLQPTKALEKSGALDEVRYMKVFLNDMKLPGTKYYLIHVKGTEIGKVIQRAISRACMEHQDPQGVLDQAKKEIDDILASEA